MSAPRSVHPPGSTAAGRMLSLDVLRAMAVVLVLGRHIELPLANAPRALSVFVATWQRGGWIGVDLFFVLSGFLVSGLLFREFQRYGGIRFGRFFARRGLKIYPPFYLLLAVTTLMVFIYQHYIPWRSLLREAVFLQNYFQDFSEPMWSHTWSLAIEEHFYLAIPLVLMLLCRFRKGAADPFAALPACWLLLAVAVLALRIHVGSFRPYSYAALLVPTHLRCDSLAFGVLLSYFYHYHQARFVEFCQRRGPLLTIVGMLLLAPPFLLPLETTPWLCTIGLTTIYLGAGMIVSSAVARELGATAMNRALAYVGSHSYSIYLWHLPVREWGLPLLKTWTKITLSPLAGTAFYLVMSIVVGILLSVAVEWPVLRLRDTWFPSRSQPLDESPAAASSR